MPAMSDVTLDPFHQNDPDLLQYGPEPEAAAWDSNTQPDTRSESFQAPDFSSLNFDGLPPLDCSAQRETTYLGPISGGPECTTSADFSSQLDIKDSAAVPGSAGIRNLGNTCFMNAGLQCLISNTSLIHHFLDDYQLLDDEITRSSLTGQFAALVQKVWCGEYSTLQTSTFKQVLALYHPQFKDYRQHDCQEFLALLLDSLHEQLNQGTPLAKIYDSGGESSQSELDEPWLREENQSELNSTQTLRPTSTNHSDPSIVSNQSGNLNQSDTVSDQSQINSEDSVQSEGSIQNGSLKTSLREEPLPITVEPFQIPNNISGVEIPHTVMCETGANFIENITVSSPPQSPLLEITETDTSEVVEPTPPPIESMECESTSKTAEESDVDSRRLPSLEDLYMKDTKTLNTNVLSSDLIEDVDMAFDSDKFHKVENTSASSETQPQFDFEHLNDLLTIDPTKGSESKPFIKETNLLANVREKFPEDGFPKKFLFSELMDDEPCSVNNIKRIKIDDLEEKNLKMQARMKVNTDKNPTKSINVASQSLTLTAIKNEVLPDCSINSEHPVSQNLFQLGQSDPRVQSLPPSRKYCQMADKAWQKHLSHNQSIVVKTFHGQFKNTVVCSECYHVSLTFEPFMYLSVPLPRAMEKQIGVVFVPSDNKQPIRYLVTLNKQGNIKSLKSQLVAMIGEESCDIIIAEVLDNHIARILEDHTLLQFVNDSNRTIYACEMLPAPDIEDPNDENKLAVNTDSENTDILMDVAPNNVVSPRSTSDNSMLLAPNSLDMDTVPFISLQRSNSEISSTNSEILDEHSKLNNSMDNVGNQSWSSEDFRSNIEYQHNPLSQVASSTGFDIDNSGGLPLNPIEESANLVGVATGDVSLCSDQSQKGVEEEGGADDAPTAADQWKTCAICLEEMMDTELMVHGSCGGTLCHGCLEMTFKHYGEAGLSCPVCSVPVDPGIDFIQLNAMADYKPKTRILSVPVVHRLDSVSADGIVESRLFGHPNILYLPSNTSSEFLYASVDRVVQCLTNYVIILTDGQGLRCSRCLYTQHCSGCVVPRDGDISLQPGDHLAIKFTDLTQAQIESTQRFIDHESMENLRSDEPLSLLECFEAFTQSEVLDEHNPWYCPKCKRNQCANKTMTVWKYPDTLVVYLKRFVFHELSSTKIDCKVAFPLEDLDLSNFISGPRTDCLRYDLQSCVCHFGGVNSGHYTSYAKHPISEEWVYYNDDVTTKHHPTDDDYSNAYVLFYQRQGTTRDFKLPENFPTFPNDFGFESHSPEVSTVFPSPVRATDYTAPPSLSVTDYSIVDSQGTTATPPGDEKPDTSVSFANFEFYS